MAWWQVLLLVWGVGSLPFAFVVARFMRAPAPAAPPTAMTAVAWPPTEFDPELVAPPVLPAVRPEQPAERRGNQVA